MNNVPKYVIGQLVYAIALSNDSVDNIKQAITVDEWDRDFAKIFQVEIESIYINKTGIEYCVKDIEDGKEWGGEVLEEHISADPFELFRYLAKRWKLDR